MSEAVPPPDGPPSPASAAGGAGAAGSPAVTEIAAASPAVPLAAIAPGPAGLPLPLDVLPLTFRKHVDPAAPVPLRMMGARGLVPMGPKDIATALYMLTFDADAGVRETAAKTAAGLPDKILSVVLRDETTDPRVLEHFATTALAGKEQYLEMIVLNPATADETVAKVARAGPEKIAEIISQNQLRFLRHPEIVRQLVLNPAARPSTIDSVTDFCVRSGLILEDLQAFRDARRRVLGAGSDEKAAEAAAAAEIEESRIEAELEKLGASAPDSHEMDGDAVGVEAPVDEGRRATLSQQISRLSVAKKIEWANKRGNKEVRTLLLRDSNKLVQMAVVQSPRITEEEVIKLSHSRTSPEDVIRYIYNNRQMVKSYRVKVSLVNNPKLPVAIGMRFLSQLRASELKSVAKNRNISHALMNAAKNLSDKKST